MPGKQGFFASLTACPNLRQRTGVWSIYRNGDPAQGETAFRLTIYHCTAFRCLMNGSNHQEERDARPLYLCPVCLRKLCWNLRVEPMLYLTKLKTFCQQNGLDPERDWYERVMAARAG